MSRVLIIKHLPKTLTFENKENILKHFGAERVWEPSRPHNYIFASFSNVEKARSSLIRLHQLEIAKRRLVVEFSFTKEPGQSIVNDKTVTEKSDQIKDFLHTLYGFNPSVDLYQPPPVHLSYTYPRVTRHIVINIVRALFTHQPFYSQTLHLMNKMSLIQPFQDDETAINFFKETFREYFTDEMTIVPPKESKSVSESELESESESESEMSSSSEKQPIQPAPSIVKRRQTLPQTRKRVAAIMSSAMLPATKKSKKTVNKNEVFETITPVETKKISLMVSQDALQKQSDEPEVVGKIGTFQKEQKPVQEEEKQEEADQPTISTLELIRNKLNSDAMHSLPVFRNYCAGEPSMRLYIKNLAKTVTEQDLKCIYKRYVEHMSEGDELGFDIRVMQEGRMKGQAFVTFPSVSLAVKALEETNGFLLKDKPMVVQFARAAANKPVE